MGKCRFLCRRVRKLSVTFKPTWHLTVVYIL